MGFKDARARIIEALASGQFRHEARADADEKNLLDTRKVTAGFVVRLLLRCSGTEYEARAHHLNRELVCHIFTPELEGERWYVKVYFLERDIVFISVHPS